MINQSKEFKFIGLKNNENHNEKIINKIKFHLKKTTTIYDELENFYNELVTEISFIDIAKIFLN